MHEVSSLIVGISDCLVTDDQDASLVAYALGSCIALTIHDPVAHIGGMLHFMLPESNIHRGKALENPFMFADSGIPLLFRNAYQLGADKKRLVVRATGGAQVMSDQEVFNTGKRNYLALRKILWKAGVMIHAEAIGGSVARTVRLDIGSGRFTIREAAGPEMELAASKHGNVKLRSDAADAQ